MKNTRQKKAIITAVHSMKNHPTAEEIYENLRETYPKISLGTVYRNLNRFNEDGTIQKLSIPGISDRFDYRLEQHPHLLCETCGKLFDIEADVNITIKNEKTITNRYTLVLHGICETCAATQRQ